MVNKINIEDIRPLLGNLSRPNYYQVQFGGLSPSLTDYLTRRGVDFEFINRESGLMCYNASLPGNSLATFQGRDYYGVTENFAYSRIYTPLTLEFYCDNRYRSLKFLEHWGEYVVSGNGTDTTNYGASNYTYKLKYPNDPISGYKSFSTTILKFENDYQRVLEYSFLGLFPLDLSSVSLSYGPTSELTRITCSFAYDRYVAGSILSYDYFEGRGNNISSIIRQVRSTVNNVSSLFIN